MEKKINYYLKSLEEIKRIEDTKPSILLHACCGPCLTYPLKFLSEYFNVTVMYNNSNIFPREEYERRRQEMLKFLDYFYRDYGIKINVIDVEYNNEEYNLDLEPYKDEPEGLNRCKLCYEKRMDYAYRYANDNGFDYFTTVMTISRQKNSQILNSIGEKLQEKYPKTKYFFSDFKKNKGIDIAREMRIYYDMYQQLYCGCKYTYHKQFEILKSREKKM